MKLILPQSLKLVSILLVFASCSNHTHSGYTDLPAREGFVKQVKEMYDTDSILNHFPDEWHNVHSRSDGWTACYKRSDDYPGYERFRFSGNLSESKTSDYIDSLVQKHQVNAHYLFTDSSVLKLDIAFLTNEHSFKQKIYDTTKMPIYDFRDVSFQLGEARDTLYIQGKCWDVAHEILPSDLIVYVIDSRPGNFWKNKELAEKEPRPVLPDKWKHGYSRGIGISRSCSRVCWWVMAW